MVAIKLGIWADELKNWMPRHSKKKPIVRVELRAGGDPHRSKKPGWSAGDMRQWPKKKKKKEMYRHPVSPTGVLLLVFLICSKSTAIQEAAIQGAAI